MSTIDQKFVEYVVQSLVNHPDDVIVDRVIDEKGVLLKLTVNPEDLGRVIGKRGVTAQSLRTLLRALGTKNDARYNLKIVNNDELESSSSTARSSDETPTEQASEKTEGTGSDYARQSRKELQELDDLDI